MSSRDGFQSLVRSLVREALKENNLLREAIRDEVERQLERRGYEAPVSPHPAGAQPSAVRRFLGSRRPGKYTAAAMLDAWRVWASDNDADPAVTATRLGRRMGECSDLVKRVKDGRIWYIVMRKPEVPSNAPDDPGPLRQGEVAVLAPVHVVVSEAPIKPPLERAPVASDRRALPRTGSRDVFGAIHTEPASEEPPAPVQEPVRRFLETLDDGEHDLFELHVQWRVWALDEPEGQNCVSEAEWNRRVKAAVDLGSVGRGGVWRRVREGGNGQEAAE